MRLLKILPILAVSADKKHQKKNGERNTETPFIAMDYSALCSERIPQFGGSFVVFNERTRGEILLDNYPNDMKCRHVVDAKSNCKEIEVRYRSVAVEPDVACEFDFFRLRWPGWNGLEMVDGLAGTPPMCDCAGDGCASSLDFDHYTSYMEDYPEDYENLDFQENGFTENLRIDANTFTFFFGSDDSIHDGHVHLEWECVDFHTTTTTTTTTTTPNT